jgi:hypothetical protein
MKTQFINRLISLLFLMTGWIAAQGQNQIEVPGDNFSLEGALELFKKSASPQEFEKLLNDPESRVNNLDLNGDGYIDYIRVYDIQEGNVHAFVIQAVITDREFQDVAVITLEKLANGKAVLQITGDEDIYGIETIIEPTQEVRTYAGTTSSRVVVNVWAWPSVQYIYGPYYSTWISPWGWGYRPHWYRPWRPVVYYDYYSYWRPYHRYYTPCYTHRVVFAHRIYRSHRSTSVIVHKRHNHQITHYRSTRIDNSGHYRTNNSRSDNRQVSTSARYDRNGRLRSSSSQDVSRRSSSNVYGQQRSTNNRSSSLETPARSRSYSGSSSNQRSSSAENMQRSRERSSGSSGISPSNGRTSGSSSIQRSRENSSSQRSSSYSNSRQSTPSSNIKRSTSRSSGNSSVNRSNGNSSSRQSLSNSNVQRSSGRSSSSSNIQRSSGSSNSRKSSGSSSIQRSSGRSSSASPRSSGNSSSSRSSGSSSSRKSSSSNSRGRH